MSEKKSHLPDWTPPNGGDAFAVRIRAGIAGSHDGLPYQDKQSPKSKSTKKKPSLSSIDYVNGVLRGDKSVLARAITLIESNAIEHYEAAREVLQQLYPQAGKSLRIGVTGIPGAGKSTLIEALGCFLINQGYRVAVLAVDPSSSVTKGSIMGDKTRMEKLARQENCFIRPSPSGGTLGGVTRKSRETVLVCEAAGYDVIIIETVGVGQSEIAVRSMVDFFLLMMIAGAGDELQGIKKGVIELADALVINKADGANKIRAEAAKSEFSLALKYLAPATSGWETRASSCSALTGDGIPEIWQMIKKFETVTRSSGIFESRRRDQTFSWIFSMVENYLKDSFYSDKEVISKIPAIKEQVLNEMIFPTQAAEELLKIYLRPKEP